ncbi:MAG: hypothetical protein JO129_01305 [Candidatus Dependentiae bacterium]|nr:hypothetical protein [Candidatus Dependentiae bacterium]
MNFISFILKNIKNSSILVLAFLSSLCLQAAPFVTTFTNATESNINLELHFSDHTISNKTLGMSQAYQVVNFHNKLLESVVFSSLDKDKNGNLFGQLNKKFSVPTKNESYNIALQDVPAHEVPAAQGTQPFSMPDSKTIICTLVPNINK